MLGRNRKWEAFLMGFQHPVLRLDEAAVNASQFSAGRDAVRVDARIRMQDTEVSVWEVVCVSSFSEHINGTFNIFNFHGHLSPQTIKITPDCTSL